MAANIWTDDKIRFLKENKHKYSLTELTKLLGYKSKTSIKTKQKELCIDRKNNRFGSLANLLKETPQSYYWIGFIYADGHLSKGGRLMVDTSHDVDHMGELAKFINGKVTIHKRYKSLKNMSGSNKTRYRVAVQDSISYNLVFTKYHISNIKTYKSPDLNWLDEYWKFISFLIGFIDGDGCVCKHFYIKIENHSSWIHAHEFFKDGLAKWLNVKSSVGIISKRNLSKIGISSKAYALLKSFIDTNYLVVLKRKWSI